MPREPANGHYTAFARAMSLHHQRARLPSSCTKAIAVILASRQAGTITPHSTSLNALSANVTEDVHGWRTRRHLATLPAGRASAQLGHKLKRKAVMIENGSTTHKAVPRFNGGANGAGVAQ